MSVTEEYDETLSIIWNPSLHPSHLQRRPDQAWGDYMHNVIDYDYDFLLAV